MNTILLGNLIKIRWIAIFGQFFAIFFVTFIIKIEIPLFETLLIILLSTSNLEAAKKKRRKREKQIKKLIFEIVFPKFWPLDARIRKW